MKRLFALSITLIVSIVACQKLDNPVKVSEPSTDFKLSTGATSYITQVVEVIPTEEKGKALDWTCDFGDGNVVRAPNIVNVTYAYYKPGNYNISYTIAGKTTTKPIRVFPGFRSYQVKNSLSKELFVSTQIADKRDGGFTFGVIKPGILTDTTFSMVSDNQAVKARLYGGFTGKNNVQYYYITDTFAPPLNLYQNTIIEITDFTPVTVNYTLNGKDVALQTSMRGMTEL